MLVPLQTSGSKPPLFFVHGVRGFTFEVGPRFARMLGPDQPVYVINANGMDGQQPVIEHVDEMVLAYLQEIRRAQSTGPLRIGGMCSGGMVAIEIARALQDEGRQIGSVILVDPPVLTASYQKQSKAFDLTPEVQDRFVQEVYGWLLGKKLHPADGEEDLPFEPCDPKQLQSAVAVATRTTVAFAKYVPRPFSGAVHVIVTEKRAPGFLHPQMPWHKLLSGPRVVHVVPWSHMELFQPGAGRKTVARLMKFMLEEDAMPASLGVRKMRAGAVSMTTEGRV
jgi:thioesterase domain-containing protein